MQALIKNLLNKVTHQPGEPTISKSKRTNFSDSPCHFDVRAADDMLKKVVPHSVATPLANSVFPVPGGPTINTPWWWETKQRAATLVVTNTSYFQGIICLVKSWKSNKLRLLDHFISKWKFRFGIPNTRDGKILSLAIEYLLEMRIPPLFHLLL